jgi:opacity protein-like surface antigen
MMNRSARNGMWLLLIVLLIVAFAPNPALAQDQRFYMALKPGAFFPQGDLDDWDTGFSGDLAFGRRYSNNLAVELNVGWYNLDESERTSGVIDGVTFSAGATADLDIFPFALTFKGILPFDRWELYGLAGIGAYYARAQVDGTATVNNLFYRASAKDSDTAAGFTIGLGFIYNIAPSWFLGAEGKYLFTSDVTLFGADVDLNGVIATGVIGVRF